MAQLMQELTQTLASLVQLRFGIPYRAAEHSGNFVVLVTVHIMKKEHVLVAVGQFLECGMKIAGYDDVKVGDVIEAYRVEQVQRTLELATAGSK